MERSIQLEDRLFNAMLASDVAELDRLIADDLLFVNHVGQRVTKAEDIGMHAAGTIEIHSIERQTLNACESENCIVIDTSVSIKGSYAGQALNGRFHHFRTWVNTAEGWRVVGLKTTLI